MTIDKWVNFFSGNIYVCLFTLFLLVGLFLGDGQQPVIDVLAAATIIGLYAVLRYKKERPRPLPKTISILWTLILGYFFLRTPFSDDIGYSISATVRMVMAFFVYYLFFLISSEKTIQLFVRSLLLVAVVATLVSFVFILFPALVGFLPLMNLLYANYGHNHLADLLLLAFPFVMYEFLYVSGRLPIMLFLLFIIGLVLTFARGAWILLIIYLLIQFLSVNKTSVGWRKWVLIIVAAVFVGSFTLISVFSLQINNTNNPLNESQHDFWIYKQVAKPLGVTYWRIKYWQQAVQAIGERPWFGSGPGTFYLQSKRLQKAPASYSWFAHSFPLQVIVELGMVGATLLLLLAAAIYKEKLFFLKSSAKRYHTAIVWGINLTFLYSLIEFNLDHLVIWLIFWSLCGLVTSAKKGTFILLDKLKTRLAIVCLSAFYLSFVIGEIAIITSLKRNYLYRFLVVDVTAMLEYIETQKEGSFLNSSFYNLIIFFHRKNSEVLAAVAERSKEKLQYQQYYSDAISYDPKNIEYYKKYIQKLRRDHEYSEIISIIKKLSFEFLPKKVYQQIDQLDQQKLEKSISYQPSLLDILGEPIWPVELLSKFFSLTGFENLNKDPSFTKQLWIIARDIAPWWADYHIELSSLEYYVFHNPDAARKILGECQKYPDPAYECAHARTNPWVEVGAYKENIRIIPAIGDRSKPK